MYIVRYFGQYNVLNVLDFKCDVKHLTKPSNEWPNAHNMTEKRLKRKEMFSGYANIH